MIWNERLFTLGADADRGAVDARQEHDEMLSEASQERLADHLRWLAKSFPEMVIETGEEEGFSEDELREMGII